MPDRPTVSIVMPCLDQARLLPRTVHSVLSQKGEFELECIVVDGGSTDGTLSVLEHFGDWILWRSEPDRGQSHALNKGFARSSGQLRGWLNSDDLLAPGAVQGVVEVFRGEPTVEWLYGKVLIVVEDDRVIRRSVTAYKNFCMRRFSYRSPLTENWISQMGVFWRHSAPRADRVFREDLHLTTAYDFWLHLRARSPRRFVNAYLAAFRWYSTTKTAGQSRDAHPPPEPGAHDCGVSGVARS